MSKADQGKVQLPDDGSVQRALVTCRSDEKGPNSFVVLGYSNATTLAVIAEGEGGLPEASAHLPDDEPRYLLLRKDHKVEMAKTVKFAFIDWTPTMMKPMRKALISTHKGQVQHLMKPFHVDYAASDKSELDEAIILSKIGMASGTKDFVTDKKTTERGRYVAQSQSSSNLFATNPAPAPIPQLQTSPTGVTADVPASIANVGSPKTNYKQFTPINPSKSRQSVSDERKNDPIRSAGSNKILFDDENAFRNALKSIRNDKENTDWVLASYVRKDTVAIIGMGNGGVEELLTKLEDDNVNFGLVRINEIIDKSKTTKFVYLKWQPETIKPMKKAEINTRKGAIDALFAPYHVDLHISKKEEASTTIITDLVSHASGSKSHVIQKN